MKVRFFFTAAVLLLFSVSSCVGHLTMDDFKENKATEDDFYAFETTKSVSLDLDYGSLGARALVRVYGQDPLLQHDGESVLDDSLQPLYQQFTDSEGRISARMNLPINVTEGVWLYSGFMGLPVCEYCPIDEGVIYNWREEDPETKASYGTKASANPAVYNLSGDFYTLVKWADKYGKANDVNGITGTGSLSSSDLTAIKAAVWDGKSSKPSDLDNSKYAAKGTDYINTSIRKYYHDSEGKVQTVDGAEIFFTFVVEECFNQNVIGYYFYPTDEVPASPDGLKKYVIIPNASIAGNAPYGAKGWNNKNYGQTNAPTTANHKVQLLYEDESGNMVPTFPPNTTIGYFIIANGWDVDGETDFSEPSSGTKVFPATKAGGNISLKAGESATISMDDTHWNVSWKSSDSNVATVSGISLLGFSKEATVKGIKAGTASITATYKNTGGKTQTVTWNVTVTGSGVETLDGGIDFTKPVFYSNQEWNSQSMCMTRSTNGYKIYGFEDQVGNKTYEDAVFTISSTPKLAILDPDDPDIIDDPEEEKLVVGQRDFATYCFEDLWPNMGDYDMNDVVIQHVAAYMFDNDNDILEVRDSITVCNEILSSGEGVKDAFALRIPASQRGMISLPTGAVDETETGSIIIFENAQDHLRETFVITRAFDKGTVSLDDFTRGLDLDPFIIPVYDNSTYTYTGNDRREVHFPKKEGTSKLDTKLYAGVEQAYFVAMDNKHPFALSVPLKTAQTAAEIAKAKEDGSLFIIPYEMCAIDGQYSKSGKSYEGWVTSGLTECTDWYNNYKVSGSGQMERFEMNTKDIEPKVHK